MIIKFYSTVVNKSRTCKNRQHRKNRILPALRFGGGTIYERNLEGSKAFKNEITNGNNKKCAVKAVKHSAVAGQEIAEILDFAFTLYV